LLDLAGFSNLSALRLYLAHGFEIIGFYEEETEHLMAVRNASDKNTRRALKQVKGKLENTFLSTCPEECCHYTATGNMAGA